MEFEKRYTTEEAAKLLGLAKKTIYTHIQQKNIFCVKIGRCKYIPESEIKRLLTEGTDAK